MQLADKTQQIESFLATIPDWVRRPEVTLLPFNRSPVEQFVVVATYLRTEDITLNKIWAMTVPLVRELKRAGILTELRAVEVILCADDSDTTRILKFGITCAAIDNIGLSQSSDLIGLNNTQDIFCHWYIPADSLAA